MNNKHFIPSVTPAMMKQTPDQFCMILNQIIERLNTE